MSKINVRPPKSQNSPKFFLAIPLVTMHFHIKRSLTSKFSSSTLRLQYVWNNFKPVYALDR